MGRPRSTPLSFAFGAADAIALGANDFRTQLVFSPALVESYSVAFGQAAVLNAGLTIRPGITPMVITREQIGDAITMDVHIIGTGAASAPILEVSDACCRRQEN